MTIASTTSKILYNGDGSTTAFPISFVFWQAGDIRVVHRDAGGAETTWVEGTQYTVTGGAGATGTLTVKTTPTDHTPAAGEKLLIKSDMPELQQAALPLGGAFPSTTVEQMVDIVTRLVQQKTEEIARSVLLPETAALSGLRLPEPGAGELIRYNAGGTGLDTIALGDVSTAVDTLLSGLADSDLLVWDSAQGAWVNAKTITGNLTLDSVDAGAAAGPSLTLDRNSASPAASDRIGDVEFTGRNSAAETVTYAQASAEIVDPTGASEAGGLNLSTMVGGAAATRFSLRQGLYSPNALGGDKGADTVNAAAFHVHGNILLPRGHIDGLILSNNAADAAHDIDIAPGEAVDGGQNAMMALSSALVKQIDASWAAGTNQGGLDGTESLAGTPDASTWYHVWLIRRSDTGAVDALFSESATAPTLPASYDQKRRIGAVLTDGAADIKAFSQHGDYFEWSARAVDVEKSGVSIGTTANLGVLSTPLGISVRAHLSFIGYDEASTAVFISSPDAIDEAPVYATASTVYGDAFSRTSVQTHLWADLERWTDTSSRIRYRSTNATLTGFKIATIGWTDPRGMDS